MNFLAPRKRGIARLTALIALLIVPAPALYAQDDGTDDGDQFKSEATLTAPEEATNARAKGKAKASYHDNTDDGDDGEASDAVQRLNITAQKLVRGVEYRVLVDGVDWGLHSPRGNSGTLALRFRDPVVRNLIAFPEGEIDLRLAELIEIVDEETGEIVLSGTLESDLDDDGTDDGDGDGNDDGNGNGNGNGGNG